MKTKLTYKHFVILGITKFTTTSEIKKAYRNLIKIWHPDKFENNSKLQIEAQEKCKIINDAFSHFKDFVPLVTKPLTKINHPTNKTNNRLLDITRMRVKSIKISTVGYDATRLILQVVLNSGSIYQYYNVPNEIYSLLMMVGFNEQYFHRSIANKFHREIVK